MCLYYRKSVNDQKEMKLLLDMYKGVSKDQRDKVQLMAAEKKLRAELEEAKQALKKIQVRYFKKCSYSFYCQHIIMSTLIFLPTLGRQTGRTQETSR